MESAKPKNNFEEELRSMGFVQQVIDQLKEVTDDIPTAIELGFTLQEEFNIKNQNNPNIVQLSQEDEEYKMVIVVRRDLKMSVGKLSAQVGHGGILKSIKFISCCLKKISTKYRKIWQTWYTENCIKSLNRIRFNRSILESQRIQFTMFINNRCRTYRNSSKFKNSCWYWTRQIKKPVKVKLIKQQVIQNYYDIIQLLKKIQQMEEFLKKEIQDNLIPTIVNFIKIPNQSRAFCDHETNMSQQKQAIEFARSWFMEQGIDRAGLHILQDDDKPPVLMILIEPEIEKPTVLMYGHLDKQPPLDEGWLEGTGPYKPKIIDNKLYGRGGADDGYAFFASTIIIKALQKFKIPHNRIVLFFETDEESGSRDLLYYLDKNKQYLKDPAMLLCLDSGTMDYEHFCVTTSLRGIANFQLNVKVSTEGVHSGSSSGILPDSFRIGRYLLDQFEDVMSGDLPEEFYVNIPSDKYVQAENLLKAYNNKLDFEFPFLDGVQPVLQDHFQQYLNNTWRPTLTVIGMDHIPNVKMAGNVLRPQTTFGLSVRLPPTLPIDDLQQIIEDYFTKEIKPLYNAKVSVSDFHIGQGFNAPCFDEKLQKILEESSMNVFGKPMLCQGEGGSIPFIGGFAKLFPKSQFIVTGVLGPKSNAHAPNEFLHLGYLEKLVLHLAKVMEEYSKF